MESTTPSVWSGTALADATTEKNSLVVDDDWSTVAPTTSPTTSSPTMSAMPTTSPNPSAAPSVSPVPTGMPVPSPTQVPSPAPSSPSPSALPTALPTGLPTLLPTGNMSALGEACEYENGKTTPMCMGDLVCVHYAQDTSNKAGKTNQTECVDCTQPQWGYDCPYWDWQKIDPAEKLCKKKCKEYNTHGKDDYYYDQFNDFNLLYWYKGLPCVHYASWPEDGELVIAIKDYSEAGDGTGGDDDIYGGCVYGNTMYGSGNYTVEMTPFSTVDAGGFVTSFYMYSDDDDYDDHDEIDFEFRSDGGVYWSDGSCVSSCTESYDDVWTNVYHDYSSNGLYQYGDYIEYDMGSDSRFAQPFSQTESHKYRIEYAQGEYVK